MSGFNLIDTLTANPAKFGEHRNQYSIHRPILQNEDLSGKKLSKADLNQANLKNANLSNTDLTGANLNGADLTGADLTGADLTGASLESTVFDWGQLSKAKGVPKIILLGNHHSVSNLVYALTGKFPDSHYSQFNGVVKNTRPYIFYCGVSHQDRMDEMGKAENHFDQAILVIDLSGSISGENQKEVVKAKESGIKTVLVFIKTDWADDDLEELTRLEVEADLKRIGLPSVGVTVTGSVDNKDDNTAMTDLWKKITT